MTPDRPTTKAAEAAASAEPRFAELAHWLGQFSRTLKTCRLYEANNPNTLQFRENLATQLGAYLERHGPFKLEFSASELACDGQTVMKAQSREDNFAMPFYRDGMRTLTFNPGMEQRELDTLLDLLLRVTSRANDGSEDLVTLLWDEDLPHLDMAYVSSETDADLGDDANDPLAQTLGAVKVELMPWPGGIGGAQDPSLDPGFVGPPGGGADGVAGAGKSGVVDLSAEVRSEDWIAGEPAHELEERYVALDAASAGELERFRTYARQDRSTRLPTATLALVRDAMRSDLKEGDAQDLIQLLVRALHDSIAEASWIDAREAVDCLTEVAEGQWDASPLIESLARPDSPVTLSLVRRLDANSLADLHAFADFARSLGPATIEWLMGIVAIAQQQRTRRTLVRTLSELCEGNPEQLAPWLGDERWYVVRNAVLAMSAIEGGVPAAMFRPLVRHSEPRVRVEVVRALAAVPPAESRPLLLELIHDSEPSIRSQALHQLGAHRNAEASQALLDMLTAADFRKRPIEEVRSVTAALGGCAGDEALPHLEGQLHPPGWFNMSAGPYCQAIARCIARIGTPAALAVLEQGAKSRTPATRDACRLVLKGAGHA